HVLVHHLEDERFGIAAQDAVEQILRVRLVEVIPRAVRDLRLAHLAAGRPEFLRDRQHPAVPRLLPHRVDERREKDVYFVERAVEKLVEQELDRSKQLVELGSVAKLNRVRDDIAAHPAEKRETLATDRAIVDVDSF